MAHLNLRQSGRAGSDCTAPYDVEISGQCSVDDFIECVLTQFPQEWGYIGVADGSILGYPRIEYARGKVTVESKDFQDIRDCIVVKAFASGGWSRMDYLITVEQNEQTEPSDLISRSEALKELRALNRMFDAISFTEAVCKIRQLSSVSTAELLAELGVATFDELMEEPSAERVGEWEHWGSPFSEDDIINTMVCTNCGMRFVEIKGEIFYYCPNCGARMENKE